MPNIGLLWDSVELTSLSNIQVNYYLRESEILLNDIVLQLHQTKKTKKLKKAQEFLSNRFQARFDIVKDLKNDFYYSSHS